MKAGKTYVYKSEADRQAFIDREDENLDIDIKAKGEFHVTRIDADGDAELYNNYYITTSEFKYFKLKENKMLKPDDMINVEMTALDGMRLIPLLGKRAGDSNIIYEQLKTKLNVKGEFSRSVSKVDCFYCDEDSALTKAALAQFKNPNQDEIDAIKNTIKNAVDKLAKLEAEDL